MWLYLLWPFIATAIVWNGLYDDFKNQGLIFKNCKFSNWHKNRSSPKIQTFFYWILDLMHQPITCKLKSNENDFSIVLSPKLWFCHFCPKNLSMTGKSIQFAAKAVLMTRQKNLLIFKFIFFLQTWKNTNKNLRVFKSFQYIDRLYTLSLISL